jgi:hypothetical protein
MKFSSIFMATFLSAKKKGSPNLIIPPEPASSHDFIGLLFIESALAFHFFISGFAHDFTFFMFWPCLPHGGTPGL